MGAPDRTWNRSKWVVAVVALFLSVQPLISTAGTPSLGEVETGIEAEWASIRDAGMAPLGILEFWGDDARPDVVQLRAALGRYRALQKRVDDYSIRLIDHAMDSSVEDIAASLDAEDAAREDRAAVARLRKLRARVSQEIGRYGKGVKDHPRVDATRKFFAELSELLDRLLRRQREGAGSGRIWLERIDSAITTVWRAVALGLEVLRAVPGMLAHLDDAGEAIRTLIQSLGRMRGETVEILGAENLVASKSGAIQVVAATHRETYRDLVALSHLDFQNPMVLSSDAYIPKIIQRRLENFTSLVMVGKGRDPTRTIFQRISEGRSSAVIVFPEGTSHAGLGEVRPIAPGWDQKMVAGLRRFGLPVEVHPVTILDGPLPLSYLRPSQILDPATTSAIRVVVDRALPAGLLDALLENDGDLSVFLRAVWFERLGIDSRRIFGMMRASAIRGALVRRVSSVCFESLRRRWSARLH